MPQIIMTKLKGQKTDGKVLQKSMAFLQKLTADDTTSGLNIEPMRKANDPRARTGRVDQFWRAVLFRIDNPNGERIYVYDGTYPHDEAIERARTRVLRVNPVNGLPEIIERTMPAAAAPPSSNWTAPETTEPGQETQPGSAAGAGLGEGEAPASDAGAASDEPLPTSPTGTVEPETVLPSTTGEPPVSTQPTSEPTPSDEPKAYADTAPAGPFLAVKGYTRNDLTDRLGFDEHTATALMAIPTEAQLLDLTERFGNEWQISAVLGLADGIGIGEILDSIGVRSSGARPTGDDDVTLVKSFEQAGAKSQFTLIEDNDELRRVLEGGDFGAWRVFLHPEQRRYVDADYSGAFRLTGGAGTGKTVVLLHRARRLAKADPEARIILTTFTKALAADLQRNLERLDPSLPLAAAPGEPGILVRGIDQLAAAARVQHRAAFDRAGETLFGSTLTARNAVKGNGSGWDTAIADVGDALPASLRNESFFESEYLQVVLPNHISSREDYFATRRPGRGVALDRRKRAAVWEVIDRYRQTARHDGRLSYAEIAALAAITLDGQGGRRLADHVLVDEAQDFHALQWQLLRALAPDGANDLFIAEDAHQRIYGQRVSLKQFGIRVQGRARRLRLNYRTTQQNLRFALGVLDGGTYLDDDTAEQQELDEVGYRSARRGPVPRTLASATTAGEYDSIASALRGWLDPERDGGAVVPETIALLVRSRVVGQKLRRALEDRGIGTHIAQPGTDRTGQPVILTMHQSKGLEFSRVVLPNLSASEFPPSWALRDVTPEDLEEARLRERSLLYVAASRARDELVVTWTGTPSELLGIS
ncbi:AAA family ATPase [Pseudoclavibacter chungangensis]|uniref:DNA 3'-5' helicase n=1 Tax=Pseudoclavibacter chungangensis TaxID=587635 RepID=A0A7J5BZA8_9MICO|nr:UvrD-helicase domain-containing protein [Pseudoclavibacter chungangensis]KAB1659686.1 AAA family ATPase [Pseudoclavibacter chungangensis]NYJ67525.1 superfamily I DNA/RNA helicase [Pseudoclavibacter chungangensis]